MMNRAVWLNKAVVAGMVWWMGIAACGAVEVEFEKADNYAKNRRVAVVNFAVEFQY